jgi:hypothetical protein
MKKGENGEEEGVGGVYSRYCITPKWQNHAKGIKASIPFPLPISSQQFHM